MLDGRDEGFSATIDGPVDGGVDPPPVLTTGAPQAGTGADASLLGTTTRTDGKVEVTYAGHPLYYFIQDKAAGDATGQGVNGFGGLWWVLTPSGAAMH